MYASSQELMNYLIDDNVIDDNTVEKCKCEEYIEREMC